VLSNRHHSNYQGRQQGIALLTAMLIVSIATVIMVSLSHEQSFTIRKTSHLQNLERARLYSLGMEDWAQIFLQKDRDDNETDHLGEDWNIGVPALPIEGGHLSGFLEDSQARINLNNLNSEQGKSNHTLNRFLRLCEDLEVDTAFIPALQDWLDDDSDVRFPDGAEDDYYAGLDVPYRSANQLMADISELRLVKGVTAEMYQILAPHITTLPGTTALNINTISETIYLTLDKNLDEKKFIEERKEKEFKNMADFSERMKVNIETDELDVKTEFFRATGQVTQGDFVLSMSTLIHRDEKGNTTVLSRRLSDF